MGLDWNPIGKAKPGREAEFEDILRRLMNANAGGRIPAASSGWFSRFIREVVRGRPSQRTVEKLQARMPEIEVTPYETLRAPRVGHDPEADKWAEAQYANRKDRDLSLAEFLDQMRGYCVVDLVPDCDGVPNYSNGFPGSYCERFSFRAQFFRDCEDMLGPELFEEAYRHHTASELADYGRRLQDRATEYAYQNAVAAALDRRSTDDPEGSPASQAHIVISAARWCLFWSERGHGMEADW